MSALGGMAARMFIWGMQYIPETGITYIFFVIGVLIIGAYTYVNIFLYKKIEDKRLQTNNKQNKFSS